MRNKHYRAPVYVGERTDGGWRRRNLPPTQFCSRKAICPVCIPMPGHLPRWSPSKEPPGLFFSDDHWRRLSALRTAVLSSLMWRSMRMGDD